ncbi:LysE family translocator [Aquamicrobium defluvii]|uniref:Lysine transporter LysE n=1 Tax=Aquamicrobium defluvii TaxID=69279 RepID=A0A011UT43_9HYPH|nr:LysE family translocator [Aquamicrobium defluvii]EXL09406.1 lysine transporter LysE [Aquamicrobium defluvii]EZQ12654.1 lysine transporter LysE [Halopseudomonas bauzanensis]TDR36248.1 threonine/homoserine/homoserine lactone efflux protein [Aquamicrobium defluvii]
MTLEFLLTSLVIVASPGTGAIYTVAAGLSGGARASLIAAFGCTLGIVPHTLAAISGLAALLHTSALAFQLLKYLGVAYLLYMAYAMFRDRGMLSLNGEADKKNVRQIIVSAILVNLLNPKLSIFFFAFLPQFVRADEASPVNRMLELSLVFMALTFVIFAAYGVFAAAVRRHVISSASVQTWMRRGFAAAFAGLAAQLAFASR